MEEFKLIGNPNEFAIQFITVERNSEDTPILGYFLLHIGGVCLGVHDEITVLGTLLTELHSIYDLREETVNRCYKRMNPSQIFEHLVKKASVETVYFSETLDCFLKRFYFDYPNLVFLWKLHGDSSWRLYGDNSEQEHIGYSEELHCRMVNINSYKKVLDEFDAYADKHFYNN